MLSASGIKNKLLDPLSTGLPAVVMPRALTGLAVRPGYHLLVGDDEDQLASHLVHVLADDCAAHALSRAGREYVSTNHNWEAVGVA